MEGYINRIYKNKGGVMVDSCVLCGEYIPEGRQVCPACELTRPKELVQIISKKTDTIVIPGELPDLNQIIAESKNHWGSYSSLKKANTQLVAFCIKQATKRKYKKIDLDITWYCKNRRKDKDNIMAGTKFILDGLVQAGTIKNDGWANVGDIRHKFDVDKQAPRVEVKITEVAR
jgi:Holliday junction resolvase RusA-like endonuclease